MSGLADFPVDILRIIFFHVTTHRSRGRRRLGLATGPADLLAVAQTCRVLRNLVFESHVWDDLFRRDFLPFAGPTVDDDVVEKFRMALVADLQSFSGSPVETGFRRYRGAMLSGWKFQGRPDSCSDAMRVVSSGRRARLVHDGSAYKPAIVEIKAQVAGAVRGPAGDLADRTSFSSGRYFIEVLFEPLAEGQLGCTLSDGPRLGVMAALGMVYGPIDAREVDAQHVFSRAWFNTGVITGRSTSRAITEEAEYSVGDRIGIMFDLDIAKESYWKNGRCIHTKDVERDSGKTPRVFLMLARNCRNPVRILPGSSTRIKESHAFRLRSAEEGDDGSDDEHCIVSPALKDVPGVTTPPAATLAPEDLPRTEEELALADMDFDDIALNRRLLAKFDNDVEQVVAELLS